MQEEAPDLQMYYARVQTLPLVKYLAPIAMYGSDPQ